MAKKPTYEELEQKIKELEHKATEYKSLEPQALMANERLQYLLSSTTAVIYTAKTGGLWSYLYQRERHSDDRI